MADPGSVEAPYLGWTRHLCVADLDSWYPGDPELCNAVPGLPGGGGGGGGGANVGSCYLKCGTGSPEGVVTAPIGTPYEQTDAASTSHSTWIKFSNAGNTGWRQWAGLRGGSGANNAIRIGDGAVATGDKAIAIGDGSSAEGLKQIDIGDNNDWILAADPSSSTRRISIGHDNDMTTNADSAMTELGKFVVIGQSNKVSGTQQSAGICAIGHNNDIRGSAIYAFGDYIAIKDAVAAGSIPTDGQQGVALGNNVSARGECFIALGHHSKSYGYAMTAVGTHARAGLDGDSLYCTALGRDALGLADGSVAVGQGASVAGTNGIAIGYNALVTDGSLAVVSSFSTDSIAIGRQASSSYGDGSIVIGADAVSDQPLGIVIGKGASVSGVSDAIALGHGATNAVGNSMVIGSVAHPIDSITVITSGGAKVVTMV